MARIIILISKIHAPTKLHGKFTETRKTLRKFKANASKKKLCKRPYRQKTRKSPMLTNQILCECCMFYNQTGLQIVTLQIVAKVFYIFY